MKRDSNIVLIGMPGCGKSTIGVLLAKALKMPFIDTDLVIQQQENRYLQEIINSQGIKKFLEIEKAAVLKLHEAHTVLATGGSVVYSHDAMQHLKTNGIIVYLQLEYDEVKKRLSNIKSRGVAIAKGQSLQDLYNERLPLYEKYADLTINCSGKTMEEIVSEITGRSAALKL